MISKNVLIVDSMINISIVYHAIFLHFQIIVFEHVNANAFQDLENVNMLPEFRGSERLIPEAWYVKY